MADVTKFINAIESEFPEDRLTWQKGVATFHPESADEAAHLFRLSNRLKSSVYITGFGNNIDPVGNEFENVLSVRTDRLNQLHRVEAEDFYVEVGSGFPLKELNRCVADSNLYLPHSDLPYVGSIGGAIAIGLAATNVGHPLPIKKFLIQAQVVTPEGEIVRPGSVCFKSVSGYDIVKIFSPSWGLLGLVVTATFRVMPSSACEEYAGMTMNQIDRGRFLSVFDPDDTATDAVYSRKVKRKFDPNEVLPILAAGS